MCGFAGYINFDSNSSLTHSSVIEGMLDQIVHRGPDGRGVWISPDNTAILGHQRLSILELSEAGKQPMFSASRQYVIVFNGEIYNHLALRALLNKSCSVQWMGSSDTETLINCIDHWGVEKTLIEAVGMFAFALFDSGNQKLILARDRIGEKPLYYGWDNDMFKGNFLFGSDLGSLRKHPSFDNSINRDALALYFRHNYIPAPFSIYESTFKLMPGSVLELNLRDKSISIQKYWNFDDVVLSAKENLYQGTLENAVGDLDLLLKDVIKGQMLSDVPLGAFLSGGIDSSTVVALMQDLSTDKIKTFSIGFEDKNFDESVHARNVATHLGTDHTEHIISQAEALSIVPNLPKVFSEPFSDSSQIPTLLVSQIAKQKVTVSLSGDAGDEIFGGYNRYLITERLFSRIQKTPSVVRKVASSVLKSIPAHYWNKIPFNFSYRNLGEKIAKLAKVIDANDAMILYRSIISHTDHPSSLLVSGKEPYDTVCGDRKFLSLSKINDIEKMMFLDTLSYLPDDILVKVDRASMAVSLESRVPFLDHRVIQFAWSLPFHYKIQGGQGKHVLRELLYRYVQKNLIDRPKMGFGIPLSSWIKGPLRSWVIDTLNIQKLKSDGILNIDAVKKLVDDHLQDKADNGYMLWNILMFQSWLDEQKRSN
jgi:asparagine synthase (glutamine-hydrolysing)